jgi:hypothetical protein
MTASAILTSRPTTSQDAGFTAQEGSALSGQNLPAGKDVRFEMGMSSERSALSAGPSAPCAPILLLRIRLMQAGYRTHNGLRIRQAGYAPCELVYAIGSAGNQTALHFGLTHLQRGQLFHGVLHPVPANVIIKRSDPAEFHARSVPMDKPLRVILLIHRNRE